ncbi:uncharacterized protein LOC109518260 isoform X2 [Hippocampus comes]|nr:PREDICTED: uncharacterized protein LOC109518260 isoform X2 [Hippocampus comes]XP_019729563.1 PREDICTED: uncharacterized protein LOC109518260 isoform X2 [Hippocampus comes]
MDDAMHGRLYNSRMVLSALDNSQRRDDDDILEFLIKTEMDDSVTTESTDEDGSGAEPVEPPEGLPMGWRRMSESSYKMSEAETERLIKVRASNEAIFTGRRNSAKPAWRAVLHELGLQGKLSTEQLAKKWDNLKRRYKELKFPPPGVESNPGSWPWFHHMNDAMEGRLAGTAPALEPVVVAEDEDCEMLTPAPKKRARRSRAGMAEFFTESEIDMLVCGRDKNASLALGELQRSVSDLSYKLTEDDIRKLVELRAANEALFTGRRNSAKPAWRGIVKEMGLTGKITPDQVAKKWDNLKTKFKDLKFPPRGAEPQGGAASWPWFQLMSDALEGRLAGKGAQVAPVWSGEDDTVSGSATAPTAEMAACEVDETQTVADLCLSDANVTYIDASGEECAAPTELSYKLSDQDTRRLITLRAANEVLFTGRRNAAKAAWKSIIQQLDLQGKVSTSQVAKKWDNLKRRFKDLKYPPAGMENVTESAASWPWFHLMNDAMEGRLVCGGAPLPGHVDRDGEPAPGSPVGGGGDHAALEREWAAVRAEREWLERERAALERQRALLEQDRAALERERDLMDQRALMLATHSHSRHIGSIM